MSHERNARYELELKRREELRRQRASEYSERAYQEIRARYEQMKKEEYDSYIPNEMKTLIFNINSISSLLLTDVFEAQNLCRQVQYSLSNMDYLVRSAKEEFARQERLRFEEIQRQKAEAKSKLEQAFYNILGEIQNPEVANFGLEELEVIKTKIQNEEISSEKELAEQIQSVCEHAEKKAAEWKQQKLEKAKLEIMSSQIDDAIKSVEVETFENEENQQTLINKMKELKNHLTVENNTKEVLEQLNTIRSEVDNSLIDEEVRREAVKAIRKELKSQGFTVEPIKIFGEGKDSYVLVTAKKPSGKQASCKVNLQGKLNYRFDHYEGMACIKDIEQFSVDLEKIYSVKLSDDRVIWENPDRLSRTQSVSSDSKRGNM